jgi:small subunit ribosomal protein S5
LPKEKVEKKEEAPVVEEVKPVEEKMEEKEEIKDGIKEEEPEEIKEIEKEKVVVIEEIPQVVEEVPPVEERVETWEPKTELGKKVLSGEITSIDEILASNKKILEVGIVDRLLPDLKSELILIGGRAGKGGGAQRIPIKITAKMHRSGRTFRTSAFIVVGNEDGLIGIGKGSSVETRLAMEKALKKAKLNLIKIKRGCGSWECSCGMEHSIPYKIIGKSGSIRVELLPAPKGIGLVASNEAKKIFKLAGIKDIWIKTLGNTSNRLNLMYAIFDGLKRLYVFEKS